MHSHHSHSGQYCTHASGDLEDCIKEAIRQKFKLFCLTEHIPRYRETDLYPGETTTLVDLMDLFAAYHAHARQLQAKYAGEIEILVGLETEYIREIDLRVLELLIARYPVDLVVGSVHHVNGIPVDFDAETWRAALLSCHGDEEVFYGRYFDHQYEVLRRLRPLVVGHFDVVLLFAPEGANLFRWPSVRDKIVRNIQLVVSYGGLFELNSAAFRKGWSSAYPKPDIVQLVRELGGAFCLSDDSHGPHQVGLNFHRMQDYIREMKISSLGRLRGGETQRDAAGTMIRVSVSVDQSASDLQDFMAWKAREVTQ